jgi:hypothetical protein
MFSVGEDVMLLCLSRGSFAAPGELADHGYSRLVMRDIR